MNLDEELLKIARRDLEASELLYKSGLYPQSVFSFQQSVEKSNKAIGLMFKKITVNVLQSEIGHKPIIIHERIIKNQKKDFEYYEKLMKNNIITETPSFKKVNIKKYIRASDDFLSRVKDMKKDPIKYAEMSKKELIEGIALIENVSEQFKKLEKKEIKVSEDQFNFMKEEITKVFSSIKNRDPSLSKHIQKVFDVYDEKKFTKILKTIIYFYAVSLPPYIACVVLSFIVHPHAVISRYPKETIVPEKFYTAELPLIQFLPHLIKIQKITIEGIEKIRNYEKEVENGKRS